MHNQYITLCVCKDSYLLAFVFTSSAAMAYFPLYCVQLSNIGLAGKSAIEINNFALQTTFPWLQVFTFIPTSTDGNQTLNVRSHQVVAPNYFSITCNRKAKTEAAYKLEIQSSS